MMKIVLYGCFVSYYIKFCRCNLFLCFFSSNIILKKGDRKENIDFL